MGDGINDLLGKVYSSTQHVVTTVSKWAALPSVAGEVLPIRDLISKGICPPSGECK